MQPKIIFLDTYYGDMLASIQDRQPTYKERNKALMDLSFGTADFYSEAFKNYGWNSKDIVANDFVGRQLWNKENFVGGLDNRASVFNEIMKDRPDCVYFQDLSFFDAEYLVKMKSAGILLAGQCSCPWPGDSAVRNYDFLYSSFPHYGDRFRKLNIEHNFLQIGFGGQKVLDKLPKPGARPIDISFVGGIGSHWQNGNFILETVARKINEFMWWGYGRELLPDCLLKRIWQGPAFGLDMYKVYLRSKMVLNRHGEVAEGYMNNMRCFEATGCGAMLISEKSHNADYYFEPDKEYVTYSDEEELIEKIRYYQTHDAEREKIARAGFRRTMENHTYGRILERPSKDLAFIIGKELML